MNATATSEFKKRARKGGEPEPEFGRLPPHSIEAEQGVIGCVLWSPNDCMGECVEKFPKTEENSPSAVFYDLRHKTIFNALAAMYEEKTAIDLITLRQRLKDDKTLESVGGTAYLNALQDSVPSPANLSYYIEIIREKFLLRMTVKVCTESVAKVYEHEGEADTLLDEIERSVLAIGNARADHAGLRTMRELVSKGVDQIEDYHSRKGGLAGLATGFKDLDMMTYGFMGGEMIVIAARPSVGKTSLAMNIAEHVAVELKQAVGVFSMEMTSESLVLRLMCSRAKVNLRNIREGFLTDRDFPKLTKASGELNNAPLYIDDTPGLSILQLRAKARRMKQQFDCKLFVIDYLQLMHSTSRKSADNRQQEIADISSGIKGLAKELDVPVIVLCQLNRDIEKRGDGSKPKLSDLRESGAIEQDADLVGLLYKPGENQDDPNTGDSLAVDLVIAKQRNGPTGTVNLTFLKSFTRYESRVDIDEGDIPKRS